MAAARHCKRWLAALLASTITVVDVHAAVTDIYSQPLATTSTVVAKPNIMFILDNSGSMASAYMPDDMSDTGKYGYWSAQCNGVAFDPAVTYTAPVKADGTPYPDASFTNALSDGFAFTGNDTVRTSTTSRSIGTGSMTFTLNSSATSIRRRTTGGGGIPAGRRHSHDGHGHGLEQQHAGAHRSTSRPRRAAAATTRGTSAACCRSAGRRTTPTTRRRRPCADVLDLQHQRRDHVDPLLHPVHDQHRQSGSSKFTLQTVNTASAAALQQNYANWYAFYRTRRLLMRTAAGRAFQALDNKLPRRLHDHQRHRRDPGHQQVHRRR